MQIYNDAGVPLYWFPSTANEFRVRASAPTDDDADGYVIIDIDDGTIGASTQAVNGSTITGTTITDGTMSVTAGAFTAVASMVATGTISGNTLVSLDTDPTYALTAAMCRNAARYNDDADVIDYTLPAAEAGLVVLFYDLAGGVITIDPVDETDTIYLDGVSVGAGDAIDSPGVVGNYIALMAVDGTRWITIGRSGTWVDSGAD